MSLCVVRFLIPAGATGLSNEQDLRMYRVVAIQMPADWTAADLAKLKAWKEEHGK